MQKNRARTSSRHKLSGMNNDVIAMYFWVNQSLQKCIAWKCYCHKTNGRKFYESFRSVESCVQFHYCRSKKPALKTNKNANKHVCIFLETYFCYFHWEQKWCRNGNKCEMKKKKNKKNPPQTVIFDGTWGRQSSEEVCIMIQDTIFCAYLFLCILNVVWFLFFF